MMVRRFDPDRPELMDMDQPDSRELRDDLRNLEILNRCFGSHALVLRWFRRWAHSGERIRLLDLATGSGDIPRRLVDDARSRGIDIQIDAVDQQPTTLAIARELSASYPEINYHIGDIRNFGAENSWDIVVCSLALHHFSESDAVAILRNMLDVSNRFVLVADLRRSPFASFGVWLLTTLWMRNPMTRFDARLSCARAFSAREFHQLARRSGNFPWIHQRAFCFRQCLVCVQ